MLNKLQETLGPGLLFAATAVGVSHLVQSTRAGADYGLTLILLIIFSCLIKYPAFRFGAEYAAATGKSLLHAYQHQGKWVLLICAFFLPVDMMIATAAVSLVTAGIFKNIYQIHVNDIYLAFSLLCFSAILLISGSYRVFENLTKLIVILFSVISIIAAVLAVPELNWQENKMGRELVFDRPTILFLIAIAGWMPTGMIASVFQSLWVCEKAKTLHRSITMAEAKFDFDVGYFSTLLLAVCFVIMGAAVMFNAGIEIQPGPAGFAAQLINMFAQVIGEWIKPFVTLAAFAVMISTLLTILDGCPRMAGRLIQQLTQAEKNNDKRFYVGFMIFQLVSATIILLLFLKSFKLFIDFATSAAFISAPIIAYFNHRAIFSGVIETELQPGNMMRFWSISGIVIMTVVAFYYVFIKLF